jgi:hypothetical protein
MAMIPAFTFDAYLKDYESSTLQQFMAVCNARLPRPQGLSRMEVVLTEMWERTITKIPLHVKEMIYTVHRGRVLFHIAAQIVALADANPTLATEISNGVTSIFRGPKSTKRQ